MNRLRILCLLLLAVSTRAMRLQAAGVEGQLMCGMKPASGVHVKLWEEDSGPDPDDVLDEGYTDANGRFSLQGSERELTPIDPIFKVYHDCDDFLACFRIRLVPKKIFQPGKRKVKFKIPNSYISAGSVPKRMFPIGVLNLETIFPKEERDLI
ncbi:hypothetical protein PRIPAC_74785 [Pristionchus pacificus]|uniref:Uncharacterized protein n=1 Tax=Pristionchus pacificus TaxID=54126 RepID=A0A2A6CG19_PRIPA|nr:hypothetical protein PRIPAC_74785 [Pristionchus pacificus]|eukprot:PDM77152.1 hypothetical protein PRIPAC_43064 [Pristionchus pacificus]